MSTRLVRGSIASLLAATAALGWARECDRLVVTADPNYPPLHWLDGDALRGASIDVVTTVLNRLHLPYEIRYVGPFARVLRAAEAGEVDIVTTLKITPEREKYLAFVPTPAFLNPISIFVLRDAAFTYREWRDLVGKHGGITRGNKFGGGFDEFMASHLDVEEADDLNLNFKKLQARRIDYFITGLHAGLAYLEQTGMTNEFVVLDKPVSTTSNYVAFSKASACVRYVSAFDAQLAVLVRSGATRAILDESLTNVPRPEAPPVR